MEETLRTLKDLCYGPGMFGNVVSKEILKAEAVKWIESDLRCDRNWREVFEDFFNITEKDLKEQSSGDKK